MCDNSDKYLLQAWHFFVCEITGGNLSKVESSALKSFVRAVGEVNRNSYTIAAALGKWNLIMRHVQMLSRSTRLRYATVLKAFYVKGRKQGAIDQTDAFDIIRNHIKAELPQSQTSKQQMLNALDSCKYIYDNNFGELSNIYADILLMAVINHGQDLKQTAYLRHNECGTTRQAQHLMRRNVRAARQQYVFALDQWSKRPLALEENIGTLLSKAQSIAPTHDVALSAWIEAAQTCGISDTTIRSAIARIPAAHAYLNEVAAQPFTDARLSELCQTVADAIFSSFGRWYLVRLARQKGASQQRSKRSTLATAASKKGVELSAQMIATALGDTKFEANTFYPYKEIVRRIGKKLTAIKQPLIADYMFIQFDPRNLATVESIITPAGWLRKKGKLYGIIPDSVVDEFKADNGLIPTVKTTRSANASELTPGMEVYFTASAIYSNRIFKIIEIKDHRTGQNNRILSLACADGSHTIITDSSKIQIACPNSTNN